MITYIKGEIMDKGRGFVVVLAGQIGYKVRVSPTHWTELVVGKEAALNLHLHVREDALELYGFKSAAELDMFELLISISGIGPKSALGVLAISGVEDLKATIVQGDSTLLTKVSGIGRKTAERIVLELREKIGKLATDSASLGQGSVTASGDEIDALMALGYSLIQAREALKKVDPQITDSSQRIREALKNLGKG